MKQIIKYFVWAIAFLSFSTNLLAADNGQNEKEYLTRLLEDMCGVGNCDKRLNPYIPQEAEEIISNSSYLVFNSEYATLEKYNAPLKSMGIESAMLVPPQMVEAAVCKYYGLSISANPELQKAAEEQGKYGFYIVNMGDPGVSDFEIEKVDLLKNGILRVAGTRMGEEPFKAYFTSSNCGGQPHWVLLRVVEVNPVEESDDFQFQLQ